jgi:hypothetical protein
MVLERLDVRLDKERRRKLAELAEKEGLSLSDAVRRMIDREYEAIELENRLAAVRRIAAANIEDVPDPETLSKQLEETYDLGPLY